MFKHSDHRPELFLRVPMRDVRRRLTELVARAQYHDTKTYIQSHGKNVAVIVSVADFKRVWDADMLERFGPSNGGRRTGEAVVVVEDPQDHENGQRLTLGGRLGRFCGAVWVRHIRR